MNRVLVRLQAVATAWAELQGSRALLACGSCGVEVQRLDDYSDLDFFAVVSSDWKAARVADLSWLEAAAPVVYQFQNWDDAWQVLFADGVYAEFGVVTEEDLRRIAYSPARLVWATADFDSALCQSQVPLPAEPSDTWLAGQALSLLYVGLCRYRRGEVLSAWKDVQVRAFDFVVRLWDRDPTRGEALRDAFSVERRFEARHPGAETDLDRALPGYRRTPQAALVLLAALEQRLAVNPFMASQIRRLAAL